MQKRILFGCLMCVSVVLGSATAQAQVNQRYSISGTVKDAATGETLIGATVTLYATKPATVLSNAYGFFSVAAAAGQYRITVSHLGYRTDTATIVLVSDTNLVVGLYPKKAQLQEVVITTNKKNDNIAKPLMGAEKLDMAQVNKLPVLFGERDVLKSIQLMPGFKSAGEGNSGFNVRGGGTDQNLILLDEAPVYNASHLLGFFSTFNSDAIKDVTVYKGGMPAQYGGRLSSVVDIKMKDGNNKGYNVSGGLGLIASRINVEGPIVKDKGSFIVSGRRTYADVFLSAIKDTGQGKQTLYFYDVNLKANYRLGKKDRIFLSGYLGRDVLGLGELFNADWGNKTATLRWNHVFRSKLFSNTSIIYSNYSYQIKVKSGEEKFRVFSKIEDLNLKQDFDWYLGNRSKIKWGGNFIRHVIAPGTVKAERASAGTSKAVQNRYSIEPALYVSHEWKASERLQLVYGLRLSNITVRGPGVFYKYDASGKVTDSMRYAKGKAVASYWNLEPRFSASYQFNTATSIKLSYNRNVQNLHLLNNATASQPTDLWLPSTNNIKPEIADQMALGFYKNVAGDQYEFSAEAYYKTLQNQIDYRNAAEIFGNDNIEGELLYGSGRAYGIELMLKKKTGKLTGWLGYTLSRVEKKFAEIDNGRYFPARQDRTHDISIVGMYELNNRWNFSATWVYNTGNAVTFPSGKYFANGQTVFLYTERNGYRMPAYHRLDIAATLEAKKNNRRRLQSSWTFGLYNAYGRENAFTITFRDSKNDPTKTEAVRTALFRFIPSVTWNFKF
jgi:TonB dependent receptor/CarboxypepD_reg-like domain/TonB-dependent Receptor Plug Domain